MYELSDVLADAAVDPGTNLLLAGPPMTGKRRLGLQMLAQGTAAGEGAIVVTTKDGAGQLLEEYGELVGDLDGAAVGVVDCVSRQQSGNAVSGDARVAYAASPVDMTGVGIKLSEFLEEFAGGRGIDGNRVLVYSLSTLLMYADLPTVFRFLHVVTGRIERAGALGVFAVDSTAHDVRTTNTLKQLFDGLVEVEERDDDAEPRLTFSGTSG